MSPDNGDLPVGVAFIVISTGIALYLQLWVILAILALVWVVIVLALL